MKPQEFPLAENHSSRFRKFLYLSPSKIRTAKLSLFLKRSIIYHVISALPVITKRQSSLIYYSPFEAKSATKISLQHLFQKPNSSCRNKSRFSAGNFISIFFGNKSN